MTHAANLRRDRNIHALHEAGATDHRSAWGRAVLQGKSKAQNCCAPCSVTPSCRTMVSVGRHIRGASKARYMRLAWAHVFTMIRQAPRTRGLVLETDGRKPAAKHRDPQLYEQQGIVIPDTPTMALHRGRIDLLAQHLSRDPLLLGRSSAIGKSILANGLHDRIDATVGTPLGGATLLHMCAATTRWRLRSGSSITEWT